MLKSNLVDNLVTGTILIGKEGLNGTISASIKDMKKAISTIKSIKGFDDINIKYSKSKIKPFIRLKVKTKEEIVIWLDAEDGTPRGAIVKKNKVSEIRGRKRIRQSKKKE